MFRFKMFELDFVNLMIRYYLLMTVVIIGLLTTTYWLAFMALPIFVSCILGLKIERKAMTVDVKIKSIKPLRNVAH